MTEARTTGTRTVSAVITTKLHERLFRATKIGQRDVDGHVITMSETICQILSEYCKRAEHEMH